MKSEHILNIGDTVEVFYENLKGNPWRTSKVLSLQKGTFIAEDDVFVYPQVSFDDYKKTWRMPGDKSLPKTVDVEAVLFLLKNMDFPEKNQAYEYVRKALEE